MICVNGCIFKIRLTQYDNHLLIYNAVISLINLLNLEITKLYRYEFPTFIV